MKMKLKKAGEFTRFLLVAAAAIFCVDTVRYMLYAPELTADIVQAIERMS